MKTREFTGAAIVPTVPGDVLRLELDARGLSQREFAEMIGRPEQVVSEIVRGKKRITAETALDFAQALGIEAEFWLSLASNYELDQARARRHVRVARTEPRAASKVASRPSARRHGLPSAARKSLSRVKAR